MVGMRREPKHLPGGKQRELAYLVEILLEEFGKVIATRMAPRLKGGQVLKIILFGSYARGDWVEDPVGRYFSDYDILVIVDHEDLADTVEFWDSAETRILKELSAGERLRTPVNFIVHSLQDVNHQLERGRYFFVDIARDGILLYDTPASDLVTPTELSRATALEEAETYFTDWMDSADGFARGARFYINDKTPKLAAFSLHQAAEHFYNCLLLVLTLYTPKSHNLVRLRNLAEPLDERLRVIWPVETKFEKRGFELLRAAYIKARYSKHYKVTAEELHWLTERVAVLRETVREICEERIRHLRVANA